MSKAEIAGSLGEELIFLISQPRSGSTLLQHILGSHEDILTLPEPWHMLHMVYANKSEGLNAEYNAAYAYKALQDFLNRIDGGQDIYADATRKFALRLYRAALRGTNKSIFLDKTPRYFLIIEELQSLFPKAKFIFLLRNPVSVFASILNDSFKGDWWRMITQEDRRKDLLLAPHKIMDGINRLGQSAITVKYEELVMTPSVVIESLCNNLRIKYDAQMLEYGSKTKFDENSFGDSKSVHKHTSAVNQYIDAWKSILDTKAKIALAKAYLNLLGDDILSIYGETREQLNSQLTEQEKSIKSGRAASDTKTLEQLLKHGVTFKSPWERITCEFGVRMKDETIFTKFRWLATTFVKSKPIKRMKKM